MRSTCRVALGLVQAADRLEYVLSTLYFSPGTGPEGNRRARNNGDKMAAMSLFNSARILAASVLSA